MLSGTNLNCFVLNLYKRVNFMLKFFYRKLMPSFRKLFVCKPVCLATHFFNSERAQASDKN